MDILVGKHQQGKTTHLIKMSAAGQGTIVAPTEQSAKYIKALAKEMKLDIPEPIGFGTFVRTSPGRRGSYLLDELGGILKGLGIETAILDDECNIEYLTGGPLHFGEELTTKIRESTKDFSKLSDFDKFVLDNGYRYETQETLQAGYDRHWKAAHDVLLTMEEFLAEAGKGPSDPAASTYKALVEHVESKKLRPGEVFDYAHYHWCLDKPEAIIVAWRTGRDKWSVNNCDTEITEEAARVKICEEWGFEAGRIRIIGMPYYDATDYQFIRFNCGHMAWLWRNGDLLQVYC